MIKKTFNINLAGLQFVIDDDAYTLANNYLDAIEHLVRDPEERSELTSDIETRMAELLMVYLEEKSTTIVTLQMVEAVIARIGQPNDFIEVEEEVTVKNNGEPEVEEIKVETQQAPPSYMEKGNIKKRLYRDTQNSIIGGVCSGIAHYLKIDPVWVRLIFVLLAFGLINVSMMTMIIAYIILWIIIPPADTPLKRMEMYGEEPTLGNIGRTVTAESETNRFSLQSKGFAGIIKTIGHAIMLVLGVIAVPLSVALCLGILAIIFAMIILWSGASFGSVMYVQEWNHDTIWGLWCGLSGCITILIPMLLLVWYLVRSIKPTAHISRAIEITLAVIWILAFVFTAVCCAVLGLD